MPLNERDERGATFMTYLLWDWLDKGVLATNAQLVDRAVGIIERMGARVIGPEEVRKRLKLTKRAPRAK